MSVDARLEGDDLLGAQGELRGVLGREPDRLVEAVRVQALGATEDGGKGLQGHADDVVLAAAGP